MISLESAAEKNLESSTAVLVKLRSERRREDRCWYGYYSKWETELIESVIHC